MKTLTCYHCQKQKPPKEFTVKPYCNYCYDLYILYLKGLSNEISHILQNFRRELKLEIMDYVDVGIVEEECGKITSTLLHFADKIKQKVRINKFFPNPIKDSVRKECEIKSSDNVYPITIYMRKINEKTKPKTK